jgi:hypothetical protein
METFNMFAKVRDDWCDALEFSNYVQGKSKLRYKVNDVDRFCCLGVLCDIQEGVQWVNEDEDNWNNVVYMDPTIKLENGDKCRIGGLGAITQDGLNTLGLSMDDQCTLIDMNDEGKSFSEIAAWIRKNVK